MRRWLLLLAGLLVWTAHFFSLYALASIFPGLALARWLAVAATLAALAADAAIMWLASPRARQKNQDQLDRWTLRFAFTGALLSFVAVLWQGLPALI